MTHRMRESPKSTRAGCLLCKPYKRQGALKETRRKFSELRKIGAADDTFAAADLECLPREAGNTPYLPSVRLAVILDRKYLKRFDRSLLGPVVLFSEFEHNVEFERGGDEGFDQFLDHAKLIICHGAIIDAAPGFLSSQRSTSMPQWRRIPLL